MKHTIWCTTVWIARQGAEAARLDSPGAAAKAMDMETAEDGVLHMTNEVVPGLIFAGMEARRARAAAHVRSALWNDFPHLRSILGRPAPGAHPRAPCTARAQPQSIS